MMLNRVFLCFLIGICVRASGWDAFIDNLIAQSKDASGTAHVDKVAIFSLDGGSPWTSNQHPNAFQLSDSERSAIASALKSEDFSGLQANGIYAEGIRYQFLKEIDGKLVLGKKQGHGAITIQKSKTAAVIAHIPEGGQQGNANKAVDVIAEYLESLNM